MSDGPFLRHVKARQSLMRTVLTIAAMELGGSESTSYAQLEIAAEELVQAARARDEAIKAQEDLGRFQPVRIVHVGDADTGTGGDHT